MTTRTRKGDWLRWGLTRADGRMEGLKKELREEERTTAVKRINGRMIDYGEREREREKARERETERDRQTERQTERETQREKN